METLYLPNEHDFKRWIKEAVKQSIQESIQDIPSNEKEDQLQNRKEIANFLSVSLPALTDWIKRGLPSHKQRGRVYFMKSEVLEYLKKNKIKQLKFSNRFQNLNSETA